jgi:omega-amidase
MRLGLVQMDIAFGQPAENIQRAQQFISQVVESLGADVVVLPEMWNTGYDMKRLSEIADRGEIPELLSQWAAQRGITLVGGSIAERDEHGIYNAAYVFSPSGELIHKYRKAHLFRLMEEDRYLAPGEEEQKVFSIQGCQAGLVICYDLRFPEWIRSLALQGAQMLLVPAQWPHPRLNHWRVLNQARAIENQMIVACINRVGKGGDHHFCGHSMVINPWGEILAEAGEEETILTAEVDPDEVQRVRKKIPVFEDRLPDRYQL